VLAPWLAVTLLACPRPSPPPPAPPLPVPEEAPAPAPVPTPCLHIARLVAHKQERLLEIQCEGGFTFSVPAAFGRGDRGAKHTAGDQRTPEGEYRIAGPARASRFHRFVPIDYPSVADADAALADERISAADHARILAAHRRGATPPEDTALGGLLGLHGEGVRWRGESTALDWTDGCIALADRDVEFVAARVRKGTPVEIRPHAAAPEGDAPR
jgi:murein L,D-transpeptidase YafK